MHPSRAIRGRRSRLLEGRRIVVAATGSIAVVELPRIVRELLRHGAEVQAVMSPDAVRLLGPEAMRFATGRAPITELTGDVEHVTWMGPGEGQADLLLLAPATANTIGKIAHGIDDTVVTSFASMALGGGVPVLLAPAMHAHLSSNPAVRENLDRLARYGVGLIPTTSAEGEEKLASPEVIAAAVLHRLARGPWLGRRVLLIGGASQEPIDEVRSITNESSGEMAVALARELHFRGAEVALWLGGMRVPVPEFLPAERWRRVSELAERVGERVAAWPQGLAAVWVPAALADFTTEPARGKIPSRETGSLSLTLSAAPKVLPLLRRAAPPPAVLIGFKLEAGRSPPELLRSAERLRAETGADWIVANDVANLGSARASVTLVGAGGSRSFQGTKAEVASALVERVGAALPPSGSGDPKPSARLAPGAAPTRARQAPRQHRPSPGPGRGRRRR